MEELVDDDVKVSVICLAYNHEKYIRNTLDGFVSQKTNFKFEVLVHDDASTDRTASIIREYEEKYPDIIKPMYQAENQYSKGIKISSTYLYPKAKGKYFAFCEGDDYWCDECKLQKQYDALEAHPECCICTCKVQCINEDGSKNKKVIPETHIIARGGYFSEYEIANAMWNIGGGQHPFQTSSFLIKKEIITATDIMRESLPYAMYCTGDDLMLKCAMSKGGFYYIDSVMSCYRLFAIGSYTYRAKGVSDVERAVGLKNVMRDDLIYDKYTDCKFHDSIMKSVANRLCVAGQSDPKWMRDTIKELGITEGEVMGNCSVKNRILFCISSKSPKLFYFLLNMRNKFSTQ